MANGDVDFSIGTDTGGSVRVPASYCGLFGLRPSLGALSLEHSFQLSKSFDTAGIFSRDLSLLESVFNTLKSSAVNSEFPKVLLLDTSLKALLGKERETQLNTWLESSDLEIREVDFINRQGLSFDALSLLFRTIQGFEIIQAHAEWLDKWQDSLAPAIAERVDWARGITEEEYSAAKTQQQTFTELFSKVLSQGYWLMPTTPGGPPRLDMPADELANYRSQLMGLTSFAGLSGLPQLHIPMPDLAMPQGISLVGQKNSESALTEMAKSLISWEAL
ncbi:amidase [Vibrio ishigakensis]|uniref:Amidase n=1 Tax=Vibrio ishigakensis TaxID=1481914 RepID=A0A0B8PC10_9VIBR|nr:amidase [Vibrio ishigakensis]